MYLGYSVVCCSTRMVLQGRALNSWEGELAEAAKLPMLRACVGCAVVEARCESVLMPGLGVNTNEEYLASTAGGGCPSSCEYPHGSVG